MDGLVFNIQRFSVHDGPGIRTTVFLQGCPLRCAWCANPESWHSQPVIMTRDIKCLRCGHCAEVCSAGAITLGEEDGRRIDFALCNQCGECARICSSQAIVWSGKTMSLDAVAAIAERDEPFYRNSGGGITVSGGEPALQADFVETLMKRLKGNGFHVALDTCGDVPWDDLSRLVQHADLVLYDIKHMDDGQHRSGTEVGNERILENAAKAAQSTTVWLRVPLIGGYNDSEEHVAEVTAFGGRIGAEKVSLLPYHTWGESKYEQLGLKYTWQGTEPEPQHIEKLQAVIQAAGLQTAVGS